MRRPTWWQRTALSRTSPRLFMSIWATTLALIAFFLAIRGFSHADLQTLLVGFSAGLLNALLWKWLLRRYSSYYVDRELGLRSAEMGIVTLHAFVLGLLISLTGISLDILGHGGAWFVSGGWALATITLYPEIRALHEGVKSKLADMGNTTQDDGTE